MRRWLLAPLLAASFAWAADGPAELRTLFHSAAEREQLDRVRRGEPAEESAARPKRGPAAVTGFVRRSDGRDTVWLDGQAVTGAEAKRLEEQGKIRDSAGDRAIEIKPSR